MGNYIFKRKQISNIEQLEIIEEKIQALQDVQGSNAQRKKIYTNRFTIFSILVCSCIIYYLHCWVLNKNIWQKILLILLIITVVAIIIYLRKLIQWYYSTRSSTNETSLEKLKEIKNNLLEEIKEKETYKNAVEILTKYDKNNLMTQSHVEAPLLATPIGLRQRVKLTDVKSLEMSPSNGHNQSVYSTPPPSLYDMKKPKLTDSSQVNMIRPLLKTNRSFFDRIVDLFLGDGPENSFALICKKCFTHNGLASKDQHLHIGFYCVNCNFLNEPQSADEKVLLSSRRASQNILIGTEDSKYSKLSKPLDRKKSINHTDMDTS